MVSPDDYTRAIHAHSLHSIKDSICPGTDYIDLATWLLQDTKYCNRKPEDTSPVATLYNSISASEEPAQFRYGDLDELLEHPRPEKNHGQILFLQGFLPQDWISAIGSKYNVDPQFLRRHLDFSLRPDHRDAFSTPTLPSTAKNIFELSIISILYQHTTSCDNGRGPHLQQVRSVQEEQMTTYSRQLRFRAQAGDSIVRAYSTLDDRYAAMEQRMSVCHVRNGEGWLRKW
ncbi:MAG: hypothetical protein Q9222_002810 [Ikaeria aurantiellina]